MNELLAAALELQAFLRSKQWSFAIIGGIALFRWGRPRTTADVDVTLLTGFGEEEQYIDALLSKFQSRVADPKGFALQNRVLLLRTDSGVALATVSAEDLIILKSFAGRPQDWADVEGILVRQGDRLDWGLIVDELTPLCELKESPETVDRLIALRDELAAE